ncbi:MAG: Mov34/MPN/PAD-1 family protein [Polyangiaceae bacterium]
MRDSVRSPWFEGDVDILRPVLDDVAAHAVLAYAADEECCGVLVGPLGTPRLVDGAVRMVNRANALHALDPSSYPRDARTSFEIDPLKFERAVRDGEAAGRPVKVLYHSHLDVGAYFSDTDHAAALAGGDTPAHDVVYLVTDVRSTGVVRHALFAWDDSTARFVERTLRVVDTP